MANGFFKNGDKVYSENLNDSVLVGDCFDLTVTVSLPSDTGSVFPNSSTVSKAKVCDVSITPNSNLSIGSTISNSSGSSQTYRLTVYPNFNRFGGFKSITLTADTGVTFYIANKGGTSPIANNLDYTDLSSVPELQVLKEYDIVLSIPTGKSVSGLSFALQSSSAGAGATINQSNITGLSDSLAGKVDKVTNKGLSTNDFTNAYKSKLDENQWHLCTNYNGSQDYYTQIYVNPSLRLVDFRYYRQNYNFNTTDEITLSQVAKNVYVDGTLTNISPVIPTALASYNATIVGGVLANGDMSIQTTEKGTKTINLRGMWHY